MKKLLNFLSRNWIVIFLLWMSFVFWFAIYFNLGLNWKLMIIIWVAISLGVKVGGFLRNIPVNLVKLWLVSIFLYPFLETIIRIFIAGEIIPYSWRYFNLAEHFIWMMFLLIISYPLFYLTLKKIDKKHQFLHLFGFLMVVGIFNEIFEYIMRMHNEMTDDYLLAAYYIDTIYDLSINIPGVIMGMVSVHWLVGDWKNKQKKKIEAKNSSINNNDQNQQFQNNIFKFSFSNFFKLNFQKIIKTFLIFGVGLLILVVGVNFYIWQNSQSQIFFQAEDLPVDKQAILLLGARVHADGSLSQIMQDRADTAIQIYKMGKSNKILISGDHGTTGYDEVNAIKKYLLIQGVEAEDMFTDHAGFNTYDSLYRARDIFEAQSLIIVTQKFHLPRAIYIANSLGLESVGIIADRHIYRDELKNAGRESLARVKALMNTSFQIKPKFLGEPIPITGNSFDSWD
jgi:vancomycin permeability regulator SanA